MVTNAAHVARLTMAGRCSSLVRRVFDRQVDADVQRESAGQQKNFRRANMPLPSLFSSKDPSRAWSITHCAGYGALLGALAALFRTFGPFRLAHADLASNLAEIAAAAFAFALLCAAAAALRNFIARRLIWHENH
jgi:hypothetical protein